VRESRCGVKAGGRPADNHDFVFVPVSPGFYLRVWHVLRWPWLARANDS
jgi:hypothetical protein